jgi:alpha-tubulin suppressor-like RCC1 family protein
MRVPRVPSFLTLALLGVSGCGGGPSEPGGPNGEFRLGTVTSLSAGDNSTCAVNSLSELYCWGENGFGQLGDGTTIDRSTPVALAGPQIDFVLVRAGNHACGITKTLGTHCWGEGSGGQLGNQATASSPIPVRVAGGFTFPYSIVDVGGSSCAQAETIYCWGPNDQGQLGTGDLVSRTVPTPVVNKPVFGPVSVGGRTACAVDGLTSSAVCWGNGADGELGTGNFGVNSSVPVTVSGDQTYLGIDVGGASDGPGTVCAVSTNHQAYCWGWNGSGQLGDGTTERRSTPVPVGTGLEFRSITVGHTHACGVTLDGVAYCWGAAGWLGTGTGDGSLVPVPVAGGLRFVELTAGARHTCGIDQELLRAYCWGSNDSGQLGDRTTVDRLTPVRVAGQNSN